MQPQRTEPTTACRWNRPFSLAPAAAVAAAGLPLFFAASAAVARRAGR